MLLGLVWSQVPVPDTVAPGASRANPSAGQLTTWVPGHTLWWAPFSISKPMEPHGPAWSEVEVGPGSTPA